MIDIFDPYIETLVLSSIIIISFIFSEKGGKTNFPHLLILILLGLAIQYGLSKYDLDPGVEKNNVLRLFIIIGVMITTLKGSFNINWAVNVRKRTMLSFFYGGLGFLITGIALASGFFFFIKPDLSAAVLNAIPFSIISSSFFNNSFLKSSREKENPMAMESTFSEITGILVFFFLIDYLKMTSKNRIFDMSIDLVVSLVVAVILSIMLVFLVQKIRSETKYIFLVAILVFLFAAGNLLHLFSLIIILVFGLMLSNYRQVFYGRFKSFAVKKKIKKATANFEIVYRESDFLVATFFFVMLGILIDLNSFLSVNSLLLGTLITLVIVIIRIVIFKLFIKKSYRQWLFMVPRGLMSVLLFLAIPDDQYLNIVDLSVIAYVMIFLGIVTLISIKRMRSMGDYSEKLEFDFEKLDREIDELESQKKH